MADTSSPPFATAQGTTKAPVGGASGAHDFVKDPKSAAPGGGGRDFTKENRAQQAGGTNCNPESVPAGGRDPNPQPPPAEQWNTMNTTRRPFKLGGAPAAAPAPAAEVGDTGDVGTEDTGDVGNPY